MITGVLDENETFFQFHRVSAPRLTILLLLASAVLCLGGSASAQVLLINGGGILLYRGGEIGFDSTVQVGTPFTFTYTIDSAAPLKSSDSFNQSYQDNSSAATGAGDFGDFSFSLSGNNLANIDEAQASAPPPQYDIYDLYAKVDSLSGDIANEKSLQIEIFMPVAPSSLPGTLSGLKSFSPSDLSNDFFYYVDSSEMANGSGDDNTIAAGQITSLNITRLAAPEPSAYLFGLLGLLTFALLRRLALRHSQHELN